MKIGIDARLISQSGVGRYIRNLIRELSRIDRKNRYVVFLYTDAFDAFQVPNSRWEKRKAPVRWHTALEQLIMPWFYRREKLDVLHVPYFNAPVLYGGSYILTIHDLTIRHFNTGLATTRHPFLYAIKRFGYEVVLRHGIRHASALLTVSQTVKDDIVREFGVDPGAIWITREGVDPSLVGTPRRIPGLPSRYFLYVGNAYPHKNLNTLLKAYAIYRMQSVKPAKLIIVGTRDYFYERLCDTISQMNVTTDVIIFGHATDAQLRALYSNAIALVFVSLAEGFGLPAVEALALGCPVICSDIPVFHEHLNGLATYVDARNPRAIADALISMEKERPAAAAVRMNAQAIISRFNWSKMAADTLSVYETVFRS